MDSTFNRRAFMASAVSVVSAFAAKDTANAREVLLGRTPDSGLQPQVVVDSAGTVHLFYFRGNDLAGDLLHVKSTDGGKTYSKAIQVNRTPGSVIATGTVRGAHVAVGRNGRLHVAWNGSKDSQPRGPAGETPMLYTRMDDSGSGFEPERNVIQTAYGLDGGGSIAADQAGNVYVFWHAPTPGQKGEDQRRIWIAKSSDDGKVFGAETLASSEPTGACGCCGMGAWAGGQGNVFALYRSAKDVVHRDIYLLSSNNAGRTFTNRLIDPWEVGYCVMSTATFAPTSDGVVGAWETKGQIHFARIEAASGKVVSIGVAPGETGGRKHPTLAVNPDGDTLLAWTEGTGWKKGGNLAWQVFDLHGKPLGAKGEAPGVPAFSLLASYVRPDGRFAILY